MDPNEFRRNLNSALQNSRGVSFLVQKRKAKWTDYTDWYTDWQTKAKANPILKWGVSARDKVVHEEDLNTLSAARVTVYGERLSEVDDVFVVPPQFDTDMILAVILKDLDQADCELVGTIRVQRSWVDDQLPDHELVSALRELYRGTATLVARAHQASGVERCDIASFERPCVTNMLEPQLRCLPPGNPVGDAVYDLSTGRYSMFRYMEIERDEDVINVGKERYGKPPVVSHDPIEHAAQRMAISKKFLEADGYSSPMLLLFGDGGIHPHAVQFDDARPRELSIAATVELEGAWPFTGAVYASEMWLQTPGGRGSLLGVPPEKLLTENTELFDPDPIGDQDEALIVVALAADGRSRVLVQPFGHTVDGLVYGEPCADDGGQAVPTFLRPVWRRWPRTEPRVADGAH